MPGSAPAVEPTAAELQETRVEALHFASKVTLAAFSAYILYTALDWSGIHTAMITCFFVAQESVGATAHKFTLRIVGAVAGAALGIASLIVIPPQLDSGGGLALLVGPVTFLAAWLATASQQVAYAGWQFAFAFYLCVLQGFSRSTKMVLARDRVLGVILANVLMWLVFTHLWLVRIGPKIADALARALEALAGLISESVDGLESEARTGEREEAFLAGLSKAREAAFLARFESGTAAGVWLLPSLSALFIPARALSLSAATEAQAVRARPVSERWRVERVATLRRALAARLDELASALREGRVQGLEQSIHAFDGLRRSFSAVTDARLKKALAPLLLRLEWTAMISERLERMLPPPTMAPELGASS